ncbi:MAG: FAD-binding oxidoreductase [Acidimicrobiia bacterium]|nr:FAD-binding oxidoreductase [Acidimicrobiia bacterium]
MPAPFSAPSAARIGPGFREAPLWHTGVVLPDAVREPTAVPGDADVLVVGGGYCGVVAAAELARRGRRVVLVEADALGTGASTRNGGMVIPELKHGPRHLTRRYGPIGGELVEAVFDAFALVERLVEEWSIDCDYERTGGLLLAHHEAQVPGLIEELREWRDDLGEEARFLSRDELHTEIGTDEYHGGLLVERTGGLQPAKYHAGLVRRALESGVDLHERTRATSIERRAGGGFHVVTTRGSVDAGEVFVATNAYADGLVPGLRERVVPIGSFIIATEPLDPDLARACIPHRRMVYDAKNFLFYWRLSPDGRMVFGGRTSLAATTVASAREVLYRELLRVHPQLTGVALEYAWGGDVAITMDRLPHCGRTAIPGGGSVAFATGCNGTGVALASWFGFRAAAWLSGEEPPPAFAQLAFPKVPLHAWRERYLPAVGWWFRARDRVGR